MVVNLALHAVLFLMKNIHVVKQLLVDGTRSFLYHLIYEIINKIIARQPGAKLAPFGWGGERVHCPAVM